MGSQQIGFKNLSLLSAIREDPTLIKHYTGFPLNIKRYVYLFYVLLKISGFDDIGGKVCQVHAPRHSGLKLLRRANIFREYVGRHPLNKNRLGPYVFLPSMEAMRWRRNCQPPVEDF